jgi:alpha-mannosidase
VITEPSEPPVVDVIEEGPLRATLRVRRTYRIPEGLRTDERARARRTVLLPVTTDLSLRAGEPFLRATTTLHNVARDHRLRVRFGVPFSAERSYADGAFDVVERALEAEGGDHEVGLPTFPCRRWVDVSDGSSGLAVFHRGTPEYELRPDALAITLLRSVGFLSRGGMSTRAGAAGPVLPTPRAQLAGEHTFELALFPHAGDWRSARVHDVAERFAYPLRATALRAHPGSLPAANELLLLSPASVQLSALHRNGGSTIVRVYNASPEPVDARIAVGAPLRAGRAALVGLLGNERGELSVEPGGVRLPLRAWEIATVRLD